MMKLLKKNKPNHTPASERGSALIITLWVALILSVLALELAYSTRLELQTASYHTERLQSRALLRAGLDTAVRHLASPENRAFQGSLRLDAGTWRAPATPGPEVLVRNVILDENRDPAGRVSVEIVNQSGKLNINALDRPTLERLLLLCGTENVQAVAGAILAFRDTRRDARILSLDELLSVPGVDTIFLYGEDINNNGILDPEEDDGTDTSPDDNRDGALATGLAAFVTTSPHERVSVNHAPALVLAAALDLSMEQADEIVAFRKARDNALSNFEDLMNLPWMEPGLFERLTQGFTLDADRFTVRISAAAAEDSAPQAADVTVAVIDGTPAPVLWRE